VTARPEFLSSTNGHGASSTNGHGAQEGTITGVTTLLRAEEVVTARAQTSAATEQLSMPLTARESRRPARFAYGWVVLIVLCSAAGLGALAVADEAARRDNASVPTYLLFWLGLLLIFVPVALRALASDVDSLERLTLIVVLGLALYLVKVFCSPYTFTFVDEYVHVRNIHEIIAMRHLFTWNPLLATAAYYPGLGALTAGVVALTGLSVFAAGLVVVAIARAILSACFYLIFESVTHSGRAAAAASLIYMANPMFLFWSSTFTYENLALPLGAFLVWWIGRTRNRGGLASMVVAVVGIIAVTVTHHVVGFALSGLLVAWWLAEHFDCRGTKAARRQVGILAMVACCVTLTWFFGVARPAPTYLLTQNLLTALQDTVSMVRGHTARRKLYAIAAMAPPAWEPIAGFAATFVLLAALPAGLLRARWSCRRAPVAVATALAIAFPLSLVPRLAPHGAAISGRSSEYVYTGLGCVIGLLFTAAASTRYVGRASRRGRLDGRRHKIGVRRRTNSTGKAWRDSFSFTFIAAVLATVVFVGNVTVGTRFFERLPEGATPHGYERTVQPDVIAASIWALHHLGPNQMFSANFIDSPALATYGEQDLADPPLVWPVFFAESVDSDVVRHIKKTRLRYLLINWRMTRGLPKSPELYIDALEPEAGHYLHVFPARALEKFSSDPCIRLIYDAGAIQIYDVSRIESGTCS
jgi:hypothetical protein